VLDGSPSIAKELCVVKKAYLLNGRELFYTERKQTVKKLIKKKHS